MSRLSRPGIVGLWNQRAGMPILVALVAGAFVALRLLYAQAMDPGDNPKALASEQTSAASDDTFFKVLETLQRMHCISLAVLQYQFFHCGSMPAPDDVTSKTIEYQRAIQIHRRRMFLSQCPRWEGGNVLEYYFTPGGDRSVIAMLSKDEYNELLTDPFSPGERFRYSYSPPSTMVLVSNGPDRYPDVDLLHFDCSKPCWGLGEDIADRVYDVTNGTKSRGDIIYPTGILRAMQSKDAKNDYYPLGNQCVGYSLL